MEVSPFYPKNTGILLLMHLVLFCKPALNDNLCDPNSEEYRNVLLLKTILNDKAAFCGKKQQVIAPTQFQCAADSSLIRNGQEILLEVTTNGTELTYSISPNLPSDLKLDTSSGKITGSYLGYKSSSQEYTISASNSEGSASCSFSPKFLGKPPIKTNVSSCWDSSGASDPSCSNPANQDGAVQAGSSINFSGPTFVGSDMITKDNVTGLTWTSCSFGQSGAGCSVGSAGAYDYATAASLCEGLNTANSGAGYANLTGWRVPDMDEYTSTFDFNAYYPAIFTAYFPATPSFNFKTSTATKGSGGTSHWYPTYEEGTLGGGSVTDGHHLRCVTGGFDSSKKYLDNQDGTVTDLNTSLVWQKCTVGLSNVTNCTGGTAASTNWTTAITACNSLSLAGRVWRLPNINELRSLADIHTASFPAMIDPNFFPNTMTSGSDQYWSSSTRMYSKSDAFGVSFANGGNSLTTKVTNTASYTRCVSSY
ncbi:DUF1566 domain-containing protein [Leptospira idonii]|uniref:DUF1566 domain-containing protein n=1 Tax=Leptospira idonii TaxID=1193500 RepID=A0A4R9LX36_9LEPT|nr:DUF1566 domain-containing protein [Leptospira idonii]TGN18222.1 DUF1566 domain-containing protein [Leptospira idonii]